MIAAVMLAIGVAALLAAREPDERVPGTKAPGLSSVLEGIKFIRRTPVMLGAISLDLFAVLFGGAIALLPLFAKQILHTGPLGLGVLRSAPAVGALLAARHARPPARSREHGLDAARRRRGLRRRDDRLRALAQLRALARRAGRQRLRRHDQRQHPQPRSRPWPRRTSCAGAWSRSRWCSSAPRTSSARSSPGSSRR